MLLTKAAMGHTSLRGTSVVRKLSLRLNSGIFIRGNNRVVPGVINISIRTHNLLINSGIHFVHSYPRYKAPLVHPRKRTTRCYPGRTNYPPRVGKGVRRFIAQETVGVGVKPRAIRSLCRTNCVGSATSLCALRVTSLLHLRH